jgi:iron complex outermembrane receptor protein
MKNKVFGALLGAIGLSIMATATLAADLSSMVALHIAAQPLASALLEFSAQTQIQIVTAGADVRNLEAAELNGKMTVRQALEKLLNGSGLTFRMMGDSTIGLIHASEVEKPTGEARGDEKPIDPTLRSRDLSARANQEGAVAPDSSVDRPADTAAQRNPVELEQVLVTGSRIANAPPASPVISITQEQMAEAGQTNLGDVIRSIPQNFSGGQNPGVALGAGGSLSNQNTSGGSALDLRGLGPDATLTLLNGHRMSYDGFSQGIDLSTIPVAALDRIEIVADGASAIYGSDAVAGVANIILKRDYDGVSVTARAGRATDGGDFQQQYDVVGGTRWSTGGFIATLDYSDSTAIYARQRDYTSYMPDPYTLLPSSSSKAALISGHQDIGSIGSFTLDALYNKRETDLSIFYYSTQRSELDSTNYELSPTLNLNLPANWTLSLNGLYGRDSGFNDSGEYSPAGALTSLSEFCYCDTVKAVEVNTTGPIFRLPGGEVRGAFGGGYRENTFNQYYLTADNTIYGQEHSSYAFGELYLPLVASDQNVPFVDHLSLSGAGRYEDYNDFGGVATPKLGLIYAPTPDFDLKGSWGRSFKTPTLLQEHEGAQAILFSASQLGATGYPGTATALIDYGGNPNLQPERATTWTSTLSLHPRAVRNFQADLSYFSVNYSDRVLQPVPSLLESFSNPVYHEFLNTNPTGPQLAQVVNSSATGVSVISGGPYNPANVVAIVNDLYANAALQKIHGIDLSAHYRLEWGRNAFTWNEQASWLSSEQQNSALAPWFALAGTVYNPPHFRSRLGGSFERGPLILSSFYNYIGGVIDNSSTPNVTGASMQTVDLTALYHLNAPSALLNNLDLSLSVQNLSNTRPPYLNTTNSAIVNYDSTNYSAVGRLVSVAITRRW